MLFHSFVYVLAFLPVVVLSHALLAARVGPRAAQGLLLASSLFFYGYSEPASLPLLCGSIVFNWMAARALVAAPERRRKAVLAGALAANILFLGCFKYANFLLGMLPPAIRPVLPEWSLPLGISFFTLTQVMYLVDTYQGLNTPNSLYDHATMVALFPYVTMGPLVSCRFIVPQFRRPTLSTGRAEAACRGLFIFSLGLFKKTVFADSLARIADAGFGAPGSLSTLEAWVVTLSYSLQIYFDFSGYSDMAYGAALMFGIQIPQNFNAPYRARSISEFWQRWHISLSNFITNYLYTPLLRSMGTATLRTSTLATLLAMGIAGLWHGPAWTFIIFGLLHGTGLAVNQIWKKKRIAKVPDWLGWFMTLVFVNVAFVFFRSPDVRSSIVVLTRMLPHTRFLDFSLLSPVLPLTPALVFRPAVIGAAVALWFRSSADLDRSFRPVAGAAFASAGLILLAFYFMNSAPARQFIYFAF
jgi:D-alanyl-lipoteichoic acid acyltransferase DltB (MBOAT superfamily)